MEIKEILKGGSSILNTKTLNRDEPANQDFRNILERSNAKWMEETGPSSPSASSGGSKIVPGPAPLVSVSFLPEVKDVGPIQSQCVQATESALTLLEKYREAMANPEMSLKQIYPLIQSLSEEVQGLSLLSEKLPSSDPFQEILNGIGILSAAEIEKFQRGDYI